MKDWWKNLATREKQTVFFGGIAVIVVLIYTLLWEPLSEKVTLLRENYSKNQLLLQWMQVTDKKIALSEAHGGKNQRQGSGSLLGRVQRDVKNSAIGAYLTELRQSDNETVLLSFKSVAFDAFIAWLTEVSAKENLTITRLTAKKSTAGFASIELELKSR